MAAGNILLMALMACVVASLFIGLFFMLRGGERDAKKSNRMMILRVSFQAVALVVLAVMFLAHG